MDTPRKFYTRMGADWLSTLKDNDRTESELNYLTRILKEGSTILDLACGYGRLSIPLAK